MRMQLASLALMVIALSGCAQNDTYLPPLVTMHPNVMFDPHPNAMLADLSNVRSDWPSTDGYYANPEKLNYRERIYDIQGYNFRNYRFPIRRFQLTREGSAVR
ncbi:MAG TPA: hypothetical protein PKN33_12435 [Phycisphaerae bacterium]|nr:hypothetical protein [Phycisphaerales bacterium]HNO78858.1 hypothetical protein [Phycisphaerae bacterium]